MIKDKFKNKIKNNKKTFTLIMSVIGIIIIIVFSIIAIANNVHRKSDLNSIYIAIKDNSDWESVQAIIEKYNDEKFTTEAYDKIFRALDEKVKNAENGNVDEHLEELIDSIKANGKLDIFQHSDLNDKKALVKACSTLYNIDNVIQQDGYIKAYDELTNISKYNELKNKVQEKQEEILYNTLQEVLSKAEEQISILNYEEANKLLKRFKSFENEEINNLYNSTKENLKKQNQELDTILKTADSYIAKKDYLSTMKTLESYLNVNNSKKNEIVKIYNNAKQEHEKITKAIEEAKSEINSESYSSAMYTLEKYLNIGYSEADKLYKQAQNAEEREEAKKIAEEKARKNAEEREKAKKAAEEKARKKSEGVRIGMSKQDVLDSSWGKPKDINTSIGSWGIHEQWIYGGGNYLYFENGILTSIQN